MAYAPTPHPRGRVGRYLAPLVLASVIAAVVLLLVVVPRPTSVHGPVARTVHVPVRRLAPYWVVRPGDTYAEISLKTGLSVAELEAFNPTVDPLALTVGERLNLWAHPPRPRPKPLGPRFWTVRPGESFGSIAASTGINLLTLEHLNPRLKPTSLQPGDHVKLRP